MPSMVEEGRMPMEHAVSSKAKVSLSRRMRRAMGLARRDESGSSLLEFGLILPIFMGLVSAIIETSVVLFAEQALEASTERAARELFTGQAQTGPGAKTHSAFRTRVCEGMSSAFTPCNKVCVEVRRFVDLGAITAYDPLKLPTDPANQFALQPLVSGGNIRTTTVWEPSSAGEYNVVRAYFKFPIRLALYLKTPELTDTARIISATNAFRSEPFSSSVSSPTPAPANCA
jgi:Flp pilus assembly protein TadG